MLDPVVSTLAYLGTSQLLGAVGDTIGQRCVRIVFRGSWDRMLLSTSVCGIASMVTMMLYLEARAHVLGLGEAASRVRLGLLWGAPALIFANGVLTVVYTVAEAQLLSFDLGPMMKALASLLSPMVIGVAQRQLWQMGLLGEVSGKGMFPGWQTSLVLGLAGALAFVVNRSWWETCGVMGQQKYARLPTTEVDAEAGGTAGISDDDSPAAKSKDSGEGGGCSSRGGSSILWPFASILGCYASWNVVQRAASVNLKLNEFEWLFLDKGLGSMWYLLCVAVLQTIRQQQLPCAECLAESKSGWLWVALFLGLQFLRVALTFFVLGSNQTAGIATASFMIAIARVAAVAAVTTGVAFCCPTFVAVKPELRNPRAVAVKAFGMVMVLSSLANWYFALERARTGDDTEQNAPDSLHFLAIGDWGCDSLHSAGGNASCAAQQRAVAGWMRRDADATAVDQAAVSTAFVLNLGDSFYDRGVTDGADLDRRVAAHQALYGHGALSDLSWYSVLGNHDCLGDLDVVVPGVYGRLKFPDFHYAWTVKLSRGRSVQFIALDTNVVQAEFVCRKFTEQAKVASCTADMQAAWQKQLAWLASLLQTKPSPTTYRVVFGHHPIFGTGRWAWEDSDADLLRLSLVPLFEAPGSGVVLYLNGHDHLSQLFGQRGVLYGTFGGGGGGESDDQPHARPRHAPQGPGGEPLLNGGLGVVAVDIGDVGDDDEGVCVRMVGEHADDDDDGSGGGSNSNRVRHCASLSKVQK